AKPDGMDHDEFVERAKSVCGWFTRLNPYEQKGPLLKVEDANYTIGDGEVIAPLYCLAVSAKRYVLFNIDPPGHPIIRKASAHGLGHLLPPYGEEGAPANIPKPSMRLDQIGVVRWQYDLWYQIIRAVLDGHPDQADLGYHPNLDRPAASRYAATTPDLL